MTGPKKKLAKLREDMAENASRNRPHPPDLAHDETTARNDRTNDAAMARERVKWDGMMGDSSINRRLKTLLVQTHGDTTEGN